MVGLYFNTSVFCERVGNLLAIYLPDLFCRKTTYNARIILLLLHDMESYEMLINTFKNVKKFKRTML